MSTNNQQLIDSFTAFAATQDIDKPTLIHMLDDVLRSLIVKKYETDANFDIIINPNKGDLQIWRSRHIVADDDPAAEAPENISFSEALKIEADFEVGEEVAEEIPFEHFSRRGVMHALQQLIQRRQALEQNKLYKRYEKMVGQILNLEVYHAWYQEAILHDEEKNELYLPRLYQLPRERFRKGEYVRAVVHEVALQHNKVRIIMSRTSNKFLEELMKIEIPEVGDGTVVIRAMVRRPGERAKVVVASDFDNVDPVGACIGRERARLKSLGQNLGYERIDIVQYTDDLELYVSRLLRPAKVRSIIQRDDRLEVYLTPDQVPLAVGVKAQNIDLASQLIGMPIDIFHELEATANDDVHLDEFADEVTREVLDKFKALGYHTARQVLAKPLEVLVTESDLPAETLAAAYGIFEAEFALNTTPPAPTVPTPAEEPSTTQDTDNVHADA